MPKRRKMLGSVDAPCMHAQDLKNAVMTQFNTSCALFDYHTKSLGESECIWNPSRDCYCVEKTGDDFIIHFPESEADEIKPPNVAWLLWHITFWWRMVFDHSFGNRTLNRADVKWLGTAAEMINSIEKLRNDWVGKLDSLTEEEWMSEKFAKFPFEGKPFYELAMWLNLELMKNTAEIGFLRLLYKAGENEWRKNHDT